eukprot:gene25214-46194_t
MAGGVPFVGMGNAQGVGGYQVYAIVRADSPFKKLADLKGKKVAHVSPTSNSGNLAPRVFFTEQGLTPDTDYKPLMSGGHDKSIIGVSLGDYEAAAVASDIFERMTERGQVKAQDFRIIWKSQVFPTTGFVMSHDLKSELQKKITDCMVSYKFTDELKKEYNGMDRFLPITYKETWKPIREVAERSGTPYNRAAFEAQQKRDADAAAKRAATAAAPAPKHKEYVAGKPILKSINLTVDGRGITAIIGPSGTGKSTLVRCINRLVNPSHGQIHFQGKDL